MRTREALAASGQGSDPQVCLCFRKLPLAIAWSMGTGRVTGRGSPVPFKRLLHLPGEH